MDRALPAQIIRKRRITRASIAGGAVLLVVVAFGGLRTLLAPSVNRGDILTSVAEIGSIEATVSAAGVVVPEYEEILTAPIGATIEAVHIRAGDSVHAGESILQLDTDQLESAYRSVSDEIKIQENKKEQTLLALERERADLLAAYDIKDLNQKFVASKFDRAQHLFDIGGITKSDLDLAALDLEIAKRELEQLRNQVTTQVASAAATGRELDLQLSLQRNRLSEIQRQLTLAEARAGRNGILTWVSDNIGAPVNPGEVIARVGDLSSFEVEATISDVHVGKLNIGGPVNVRIRDRDLRGRIASIRPEVQGGVATFVIALEDKFDRALHPNLRTDVFVITATVTDVVRVKNGPFYNGSVDQEVFTIDGDKAVKRVADIGVSNFDWVELKDGIAPGEEVIVSDTRSFKHQDEIAIR